MLNETEHEYILLFYKENSVVGSSTCITTKENIKVIGKALVSSEGYYLPNQGIYDTVGWIKNTNMDTILQNVMADIASKAIKN